jgi:hypothetical protein
MSSCLSACLLACMYACMPAPCLPACKCACQPSTCVLACVRACVRACLLERLACLLMRLVFWLDTLAYLWYTQGWPQCCFHMAICDVTRNLQLYKLYKTDTIPLLWPSCSPSLSTMRRYRCTSGCRPAARTSSSVLACTTTPAWHATPRRGPSCLSYASATTDG